SSALRHEPAGSREVRGPAGREGEGRSRESFKPAAQPHQDRRMTEGGGSAPQGGRAPSAPPGRSSAVAAPNAEEPPGSGGGNEGGWGAGAGAPPAGGRRKRWALRGGGCRLPPSCVDGTIQA